MKKISIVVHVETLFFLLFLIPHQSAYHRPLIGQEIQPQATLSVTLWWFSANIICHCWRRFSTGKKLFLMLLNELHPGSRPFKIVDATPPSFVTFVPGIALISIACLPPLFHFLFVDSREVTWCRFSSLLRDTLAAICFSSLFVFFLLFDILPSLAWCWKRVMAY